jgi:hypothetical protein
MVLAYDKLMELKNNRREEILKSFKKPKPKKTKKDLVEVKLDEVIKKQFDEDNFS